MLSRVSANLKALSLFDAVVLRENEGPHKITCARMQLAGRARHSVRAAFIVKQNGAQRSAHHTGLRCWRIAEFSRARIIQHDG